MMWLLASMALAQVTVSDVDAVEIPQGPTLASIRVRAMGGTCVSLAESATCHIANPTSVVIRRPGDDNRYSIDSTLQLPAHPVYRWAFGWIGENAQQEEPYLRIRAQVGANIKFDGFGIGLHLRQDRWELQGKDRGSLRWSMPIGLSGGQLAGAVAPVLLVGQFDGTQAYGLGAEGGGLVAPDGSPWRVGWAFHTPVRAKNRLGQSIREPWRLATGVGYGFDLRNAARDKKWIDRVHQGKHWGQVHTEVELVGDSRDARDLLELAESGVGITARLGGEASLHDDLLRLRAGTYGLAQRGRPQLEPHLTAGATVHLFTFLQNTRWRGGGVVDWSPDDVSFGFGLETW